ncbi:MAG: PIN domain-containing protein [Moraxellaceae bacterium]|nr:PIN domain-containing protein [Moraxellaceae bacterium]
MAISALLDVNVLIALFDNKHQHHAKAMTWLEQHVKNGNKWASCPITQNGCLRILATPNYPNTFALGDIKMRLQQAVNHPNHVFFADNISLTDDSLIHWKSIQGYKQLTDVYLLALAQVNNACFVTIDNRINDNVLVGKLDIVYL